MGDTDELVSPPRIPRYTGVLPTNRSHRNMDPKKERMPFRALNRKKARNNEVLSAEEEHLDRVFKEKIIEKKLKDAEDMLTNMRKRGRRGKPPQQSKSVIERMEEQDRGALKPPQSLRRKTRPIPLS